MILLPPRGLRRVLHLYGLRIREAAACPSLYKQRAGYYVKTNKGAVFVKPFLGADQRLNLLSGRIARLKRAGYQNMPDWLITKKRRRWVKWGGRSFYVTRWIKGKPLQATIAEAEALGEALAKFHMRALQLAPKSNQSVNREMRLLRSGDAFFRRRLPLLQKKKGIVGRWYREHGRQCTSLANRAWATLNRPESKAVLRRELKRCSLIHGDVTRPNVLVSRGRIYFVDWDSMKPGFSLLELARTLANTADFSPIRLKATLRGYEKYRPLRRDERRVVCALFHLPREAWHVAQKRMRSRGTREFAILRITWSMRVKAARWLNNWAEQ